MTSRKVTGLFIAMMVLLGMTTIAFGQSSTTASSVPTSSNFVSNVYHQKYLLGDWGGSRTKLEEKGVVFDVFYMSDMLYAKDGIYKDSGGAWNRVRGTMDIDIGKLSPNLKGLTFHVTGLWQGGPNVGAAYLGSISNPSTLVSARTTILDSYWLAYAMADGKVTLRAGQFASMDYYGLPPWIWHFMLEPLSYGFQNRFNDYASYDPASGPGVQLVVNPYHFLYYSVAYTSGNRDPYKADSNGFHFVKKDSGVLSNAVGVRINQPGPGQAVKDKYYGGQYEVGSTYNGDKFTDPFKHIPAYLGDTGNYVVYLQGDQAVYRPKAGSNTGLDIVGGISYSPNEPYNFVDKNVTFGVLYNGPIPSRPNDHVNFGLSYTHVSDTYKTAFALANPGAAPYSSEKAYEFNYLFQATPYWLIQPTMQVYQDVGGLSKKGTAVAVGFRTKVTF